MYRQNKESLRGVDNSIKKEKKLDLFMLLGSIKSSKKAIGVDERGFILNLLQKIQTQ